MYFLSLYHKIKKSAEPESNQRPEDNKRKRLQSSALPIELSAVRALYTRLSP